jgi:hypothetical protein
MEKSPRPYLTAGLVCDNVLEEKNGTLSVVRIIDRVGIQIQGTMPAEIKAPIPIRICLLVCLKSGPSIGDHTLVIALERPNGERKDIHSWPLKLQGNDKGQNVVVNLNLGVQEEGLHWFDVLFDQESLTRIPLLVALEMGPQTKP